MKTFTLFLLFFAITLSVKSQDTLVQADGEKIVSKILEITPDYVKYKKFDNLDGPLISIQKSKVYMIVYENGTKDVLNKKIESTEKNDNSDVQYNRVDKMDKGNVTTVTYSKIEYKHNIVDNKIFRIVKLNPLLIFNGDIPFSYEHRLSDHVGLEAGVGITLTDYYYFVMNDEIAIDNMKSKIGYSFVLSPHFYTSKYYLGLQELYFSPEIRFRSYQSEVFQYNSQPITPPIDQHRLITDFQLKLGFISYWSDNVCVDYYCGIGVRNRNITTASFHYSGNSLITTMNTTKDIVPCISAGIKIGYGW